MKQKYIMIIASLLFGLFWVVAPANMKDKVVGLVTFASADRQCFNYYKNEKDYFKDPDSAYMESSYFITKKDELEFNKQFKLGTSRYSAFNKYDSVMRIKVRAKNAMGGYVSEVIECPLVNNNFDENAVIIHNLNVAIGGYSSKSYVSESGFKNLAVGQRHVLNNIARPAATVRLVSTPGDPAAYDDTEEADRSGACQHIPQGTPVSLLEFADAYGKQKVFAKVRIEDGECKGNEAWALAIDVQ